MARVLQQYALAALILVLSANAFTFQIARQGAVLAPPRSSSIPCAPKSNLFGCTRPCRAKTFMTEAANEPEEPDIKSTNDSKTEKSDEVEEKRTRTWLLTVPLFFKFVIVLLLKFATDLVVYPLLWLYRLAGIVKRKFKSLIGRGDTTLDKTNGES
ncbi:unnamed protein product [Cylindrotheca closterium]|uniref:Uncharacterized protein n=1 Tax=Cylindrotheca closterium TaxID=2856 RepID=A0AAD2FC60_9STRA|nr:unnamed protein product [Cylindrotheca closterium]